MTAKIILSNPGNFSKWRGGQKIIRGYFHRTAVKGDTAEGEANYFHNHVIKASFYKVIDLAGNVVESVLPADTEWATNEWIENERSLNYEFTGLNGTPLTPQQIAAAIADIKADPATKGIVTHRLTLPEILDLSSHFASGWANHLDVTRAFKIPGGHVDAISEEEVRQILAGLG